MFIKRNTNFDNYMKSISCILIFHNKVNPFINNFLTLIVICESLINYKL